MRNNLFKRALCVLLGLVLAATYLPVSQTKAATVQQPLNIIAGSKKADANSIIWEDFFGPDVMHTEFAGAVWTDKSVFAEETDLLPGVTLDDNNNFLVALSALASNVYITGYTTSPTDTMLVLDLSASMVDKTYDVGYIRSGERYHLASGIDMSLMEAMVKAANDTIAALMKQNSNNRVGVVLYSGNISADSAIVVLPLGRYTGVNGAYLTLDAEYTTSTLYTYDGNTRWWASVGQSEPYVDSASAVSVSVADTLKTEEGAAVADLSKVVEGGTYTQNGLLKAMNEFLAVTDTIVPEGKPQAGAERMPVIALMSAGAPTIATTSYTSVGNANTGDGTTTNDTITFLTQLTAAYVRGMVAQKYQESASDDENVLFMTLGLGTEYNAAATQTLYPNGSSNNLRSYWNTYLAANDGAVVTAIGENNTLSLTRNSAVEAMNYVDKYFYASDAEGLSASFAKILNQIQQKAESYSTLVEGDGANFSGYVTFEDVLGEMMQVHDVKGILMNDGKGGQVLYTGKGVAKSINEGALGSQSTPTERGDELIRTVKERIPGITTPQAQRLISWAYLDEQLYYVDDTHWSNYIGWYADAQGNYVGFWDKDTGYENAPAGAVYANRSYGYLGDQDNTDMMHVVVLVRTELATRKQTVYFKIPAALLPTVQYKVTLNPDDATKVDALVREGDIPMQLVFEAGLRSDVNAVNLEQKIAEHVAAGGHIHRNSDGTVNFYTNEWAVGNDTNQNGIPDPEEVETAKVTESHFHPAMDNTRYYYTEDTPILDASGNQITDPNAVLSGTYHIDHYYYNQTQRISTERTVAAETIKAAKYIDGRWVIPGGTMFRELTRLRVMKEDNATSTLDYSRFSATFAAVGKQDVYSFLGNNGTFTVAPATGITLRQEISGEIANDTQFTYQISLSDIPDGTQAAPKLTDANGENISGVSMSEYRDGQFTLTMPAGITAYISGIPAGAQVQIAEQVDGDYKVVGATVAGQEVPADQDVTLTVPAYRSNGGLLPAVAQMVPVVITNGPNLYGDLIISKDVFHDLPSDPAALAQKEFTFHLTLTGSKIAQGDIFQTSEGAQVKVGANGEVIFADGSPIVLRNEESITILQIPAGTFYQITEDQLPGFALDSIGNDPTATVAAGIISGRKTSLADFYNRYPAAFFSDSIPLSLRLTEVLKVLEGAPGDEEFTFVLQRLLEDGSFHDVAEENGQYLIKVGANETKQADYQLLFGTVGTYFFRIVEMKPSEVGGEDTPGMTYSTMQALFEVVVTDDNMDGELELEVREEAHVIASGDKNGIQIATTFENIYEAGATNTQLHVQKTLTNPANANIALTEFHFDMVACDQQATPLAGAPVETVTTSALGEATFNLVLDEEKTYYYLISEQIPANARTGMAYSPAKYLFKVTVEKKTVGADTVYVVAERSLTELTTNTQIQPINGIYTACFENVYSLQSTHVEIPYQKELIGRQAKSNEQFWAQLVQTDGMFHPLENGLEERYVLPYTAGSAIKLTCDKVGTYHYKLTEEVPELAQYSEELGKYISDGVAYDPAVYHITVNVTDNGNGALVAETVIQ